MNQTNLLKNKTNTLISRTLWKRKICLMWIGTMESKLDNLLMQKSFNNKLKWKKKEKEISIITKNFTLIKEITSCSFSNMSVHILTHWLILRQIMELLFLLLLKKPILIWKKYWMKSNRKEIFLILTKIGKNLSNHRFMKELNNSSQVIFKWSKHRHCLTCSILKLKVRKLMLKAATFEVSHLKIGRNLLKTLLMSIGSC